LRRRNRPLGIRELLDGVRVVEAGVVETADDLGMLLGLLWCHSPEEAREFELIWQSLGQVATASRTDKRERPRGGPPAPKSLQNQNPGREPRAPPPTGVPRLSRECTALPVRAPFISAQSESATSLDAYWPVSRRSMVYAWRYLRRPLA